jgi:hypothetical protein
VNTFAFTFATIPDINAGRKLYNLDGLDDKNIAEVMFHRQRQLKGNEQLPLHQQQIIALSAVLRTADSLKIITLDARDGSEESLLQQFFALMEKHAPMLVCWNGAAFERPIMHYRSILHGIGSTHYWHNNTHHVDLVSQLAGDAPIDAPIDEIASLLGMPNKGEPGNNWDRHLAGELTTIHNDITTDALNTYLIHLRLQLVSGRLYQERYRSECQKLRDTLKQQDNEHIHSYLSRWTEGAV